MTGLIKITSVVCLLVLAAASLPAEDIATDEWKKLSESGVTLEYRPGDEEIAAQLLPEIVKKVKDVPVRDTERLLKQLDDMTAARAKSLQFIGDQLGLEEPGYAMAHVQDTMINFVRQSVLVMPEVHHIKLWRKDELIDRIKSANNDTGMVYDAKTDTFSLSITETETGSVSLKSMVPVPVAFTPDQPIEQIVESAKSAIDACMDSNFSESWTPWAIYYEVAQAGLIQECNINSLFRRWFCEGVARWVAEMCTKEIFGEEVYQQARASAGDVEKYQALKEKVDLLGWRAPEAETELPRPVMDKDLAKAHSAFAVYEIRRLLDNQSGRVLQSILTWAGNNQPVTSQGILDAIKKVTEEDLSDRLKDYGTVPGDKFKGMALTAIKTGTTDRTKPNVTPKWTSTIPIVLDGNHLILFGFRYELLNPPAKGKIILWNPDKEIKHVEEFELAEPVGLHVIALDITEEYKPGSYTFTLTFDGQVYRDVPFTLTDEGAGGQEP